MCLKCLKIIVTLCLIVNCKGKYVYKIFVAIKLYYILLATQVASSSLATVIHYVWAAAAKTFQVLIELK